MRETVRLMDWTLVNNSLYMRESVCW